VSNLPLGSGGSCQLMSKGSPVHVSSLSGPVCHIRYPASYPHVIRGRTRPCGLRFPAVFRLPAFASWTPSPAGTSAPITVGLPPPAPLSRTRRRTHDAGFTRSTRVRHGPGRALSIPQGQRSPMAVGGSAAVARRFSAASPYHPGTATQPGMFRSRGISKSFRLVALPALPLVCNRHGWDGGP